MGRSEDGGPALIFDLFRKSGGTRVMTTQDLARMLDGGSSGSGVSVTPDSAMRLAVVFACVRVLAESVGQLPLHLFRRDGKSVDKADDHPLFSLLHDAPNEYQTSQEFREMVVAHLCLRGNHYSHINRGGTGGRIREIVPLNPDAVTTKQLADRSIVYEVRYPNGTQIIYPADQIFHVRGLTLDGLTGVSPITYNREAIGLGIAEERHAAKLFSNGANPGGVLSTEQALTPDAFKRINESWVSKHGGLENAHRTAILEAGLKWQQVGISPVDAQMIESRKLSRMEICGFFRVPPTMVADLDRATYSNTEQQARSFVDFSLMPYLTRIESRVGLSLLSPSDRKSMFARFNTAALLRGDMTARANFYSRQLQNGAMSPNEIRELENMNPRPDGDVWLTPINLSTNPDAGASSPQNASPAP